MRSKIKIIFFTLGVPALVLLVYLGVKVIGLDSSEGVPLVPLENPGFEAGTPGGSLAGWQLSGPPEAFILETGARRGDFRLTQAGAGQALEARQRVEGLVDGWYTLRAWVRSSGDQAAAAIGLVDCGGAERFAAVPVVPADRWLRIVVSGQVRGGVCSLSLGSEGGAGSWVSFDEVELAPGRAALDILGADVSSLRKSEDLGGVYADEQGNPGDALEILRDHGLNYMRLRVWVAPADSYHETEELLLMARRARDLGLKVLVDFHYSDTWADPGKQTKPKSWAELDLEGLKKSLYDHTFQVCQALKAQGTPPDMVQVGNEIQNGILWPEGHSDDWAALAALLKEGYRAVKDCSPDTLVMLHIAEGGDNDLARWWYDNAVEREVPFDLIGVSYYPFWHGNLADLQYNLDDIARRYDKDVVVVETAFPFTRENNDHESNIIAGQIVPGYTFSPQGQRKMLADVMAIVRAVPNGRGLGVFYWDATWTAVPGNGWNPANSTTGNGWENQALFDYDDRATPAMSLFGEP